MYSRKRSKKICIDNKLIRFWYLARDGKAFWEKNLGVKCKHLVRGIFFTAYSFEIKGDESADTIFFVGSPRKDILEHFYAIYESCDISKSLIITNTKRRFNVTGLIDMISNFSVFAICKEFVINEYDDAANVISSKKMIIPFWGRIYLWAFYSQILAMMKKINEYLLEKKMAVVLNDCMAEEALFVQMAKRNDVITVCCQEGMFCDNPNNKIDLPTMYLEQTSDYYILWGNFTEKLYHKYNNECRAFVCGDPFIKKSFGESTGKWCVVCDVPPFHNYNQEMIDIVTKVAIMHNRSVDIRLHPQERGRENSYRVNESICKFVIDDSHYDAVFTHMSTMYYTFMAQGINTYRFLTEYSRKMPAENETAFANIKELELIMDRNLEKDKNHKTNEYLAFIADDAKEKYKETFRKIIGSNYERVKS